MQLTQELPDYTYALKSADGRSARVNDLLLQRSFILMPDQLVEEWPVGADAATLQPGQMIPVLELQPALVLLGTGTRQVFPAVEVMAAFLTRGIGIEIMDNAAAARTYNVLASEGRRVAAAFLLGA
ncbi:Mth938-like domain-containing protein [Stenotrophomonas sp. MMGLT7]|uniref:Mth938-like domain-containing protein n=1 Tax=Stenotrophomonas sp. MMGLT7 TaxID=2901227 RepID=UPI001E4D2B1D|nr:Mth938-like domain-containing protein [Stenotrophomonas sp. MMGLT7]MCD7097050.1 Mth938-like domain-containing protein [Stenotrophomonas sp. MMGLT7]